MQRFLLVGASKAYRESNAFDAVQDPEFKPGAQAVEFDTAAQINEIYAVTTLNIDPQGTATATGSFYARTIDEIIETTGANVTINLRKISVFPFRERKARSDSGKARAA